MIINTLQAAIALATGVPPTSVALRSPTTIADERNGMRDACAALQKAEPDKAKSRAAFKQCVEQIPYDGDLPPKPPVGPAKR